MSNIKIVNASEHNLKNVDVSIPKDSLVVVTGVSGSGKSSLVFDTLYREGQRRYLSSLSSYARQYLGKIGTPEVEHINGLMPAISVDQKTVVRNPRSTIGTMSEIQDHLRLLFSRASDDGITRKASLFSFNSPNGACPNCQGLGVEDKLDPELLISDPSKTIREGALVITTPSGYLVYSQVTLDVLNTVCQAHGFHVDIPWQDMTEDQKDVVLNGSDRIKIPFGKHTLESRLKWSGITAKPREEGHYKGILPVMQEILKRDRNKNILRFVRSVKCSACEGSRLGPDVLKIAFQGKSIAQLSDLTFRDLFHFFCSAKLEGSKQKIAEPIISQINQRIELLRELGLGYLTCARESTTLSGGEAQRIRLVNQVASKLQGILYVLDEPSIGLHQRDNQRLLNLLQKLKAGGNTVVVVEHDEETMKNADWLIDLGPGAGIHGGEILFEGSLEQLDKARTSSTTASYLLGDTSIAIPKERRHGHGKISVIGASQYNLKHTNVHFYLGALNVVTGVSGAGKSTLVERILAASVRRRLGQNGAEPGEHCQIDGLEKIDKLIDIDQSPIGRTPRSNPATYTKLFDHIRDLFATEPLAKENGFNKGTFSFNVKGGRCEDCQGAGVQQVGMHFLADVDVVCDTCEGKRFHDDTLQIEHKGKNIHDVLELSVEESIDFFESEPKILRFLKALNDVGLGYITLGQPSTTLSGGEAQRIKLASELAKPATKKTLYILNEPTTGLHAADIKILLKAVHNLVDAGNTVIVIEHNLEFIKTADRVIDLGPGSGTEGGRVVAAGTPEEVSESKTSQTGRYLKYVLENQIHGTETQDRLSVPVTKTSHIQLRGVETNNLKNVDIDIPHNQLTVVTGVSGSGKSSLAYHTIYAEGRRLFSQSLSAHARRYFKQMPTPPTEGIIGMNAAIAVGQKRSQDNPRSIVATITEMYDLYRLLYSRAGTSPDGNGPLSARAFSFNHSVGACPGCKGLGIQTVADPQKLISHPKRSLFEGAMEGSKTGQFYTEKGGQHLSILAMVGQELGVDFSAPWNKLSDEARAIAMHGTGDRVWHAVWKFDRKGRKGEHSWDTPWLGFCGYVEEEYERVHGDHRGQKMLGIMKEVPCSACDGQRLAPLAQSVRFAGTTISELISKTVDETSTFLLKLKEQPAEFGLTNTQGQISKDLIEEAIRKVRPIQEVGLGYLNLNRRTSTLSGGELQRLLIAARLGSELCGVTYVLDEPTIGLHGRDTQKLIGILQQLRDQGNTVVVVEHDEEAIRAADHVIDMGPGAGTNGGQVVSQGDVTQICSHAQSLTGQYLTGGKQMPKRESRRSLTEGLSIHGARANNLDNITLTIPAGGLIAISGVSGSGKSSLVHETIVSSFRQNRPVCCDDIFGLDNFEEIMSVDHSPIGSSPLSTPATYTGLFDRIRELFAGTKDAKDMGFKKGSFSFNSKGGRCEACQGMGQVQVEMGFLADVWLPCEECDSKRYNDEILQIKWDGRSIFDVLQMTFEEATVLFESNKMLKDAFNIISRIGLGYMTLGQPASTISGGEAQRLKLAKELIRMAKKQNSLPNLYVFDEPTTGLHFEDVANLLRVFHTLADEGHTLLVVEHNLDVLASADWIIDLGPEGGSAGGKIVAAGSPEKVAANRSSLTGKLLSSRI